MGLFALSAGFGAKDLQIKYRTAGDPYSRASHAEPGRTPTSRKRSRKNFTAKSLRNTGVMCPPLFGIRPAPGYPSCPDHSEKATLWKLPMSRSARECASRRRI